MGQTPTYQLPWPEPNDPADVPTDMKELAEKVEWALDQVEARMVNYGAWAANGSGTGVKLTAVSTTQAASPTIVIPETSFSYSGPGAGNGAGGYLTVPTGQVASLYITLRCRFLFAARTAAAAPVGLCWLQQRSRAIGASAWGSWVNAGFSPYWGAYAAAPVQITNAAMYANANWSEFKAKQAGQYQFRVVGQRNGTETASTGAITASLIFAEIINIALTDVGQTSLPPDGLPGADPD